jgi:hypothetical protein
MDDLDDIVRRIDKLTFPDQLILAAKLWQAGQTEMACKIAESAVATFRAVQLLQRGPRP